VVSNMIVDLALPERNLLIELDGASHEDRERDARRDGKLRGFGFNVLRFTNEDIFERTDLVLSEILFMPRNVRAKDRYLVAMRTAARNRLA